MDIAQLQQQISKASSGRNESALPPVDSWHPDFCGDIDLIIKRNGQWWHEGHPFTRASLVKMLSHVLKKEDDKYYLVTPTEKLGIQVEDVPFIVIDDVRTSDGISVITQTGDTVALGPDHPVELRLFEGNLIPYCHIRGLLWARVHQNVLYRWSEEANETSIRGSMHLVMQSPSYRFCIGASEF